MCRVFIEFKGKSLIVLASLLFPAVKGWALFGYITFRSTMAFFMAFLLAVGLGPVFIRWLKSFQKRGQPIRDDGPQSHLETKQGTPTMGGLLILMAFGLAVLCWARLDNMTVWWLLFLTFGFAGIGFGDDALKLKCFSHRGLRPTQKLVLQILVTGLGTFWLQYLLPTGLFDTFHFPFLKNTFVHLGALFPLFVFFVLVGSANAVNLTDGLDGLVVGPLLVSLGVLGGIAYVVGHAVFADYLYLPHVPGASEVLVLCAAFVGALLGFLWYNAPPAQVFMGDTGSMAAGGFLGGVALLTKHELVLALAGGVFVAETVSVILQVGSYKLRRKRIFLMAPLHHHFEKKGWAEPKVVMRFWIVSLILGVLALVTLKVR